MAITDILVIVTHDAVLRERRHELDAAERDVRKRDDKPEAWKLEVLARIQKERDELDSKEADLAQAGKLSKPASC